MAGSEDHDPSWVRGQKVLESLQEHTFFFFVDGAAANENGACARLTKAFPQAGHDLGRRWRRDIEFQIARDFHALLARSDRGEPLTIFPGLCEEQIDVFKNLRQPEPQPMVSG